MKKLIKLLLFILLVSLVFELWGVQKDGKTLKDSIARLQVVTNYDSNEGQNMKLRVKDAVVTCLQPVMDHLPDKEQTLEYFQKHLWEIEKLSNRVLDKLGIPNR